MIGRRSPAEKFNHADIVLIRGPGATMVGRSIPEAAYRAVYAERNAQYQRSASRLGEVVYQTETEGLAGVANVEVRVQRLSDVLKSQPAKEALQTAKMNSAAARHRCAGRPLDERPQLEYTET